MSRRMIESDRDEPAGRELRSQPSPVGTIPLPPPVAAWIAESERTAENASPLGPVVRVETLPTDLLLALADAAREMQVTSANLAVLTARDAAGISSAEDYAESREIRRIYDATIAAAPGPEEAQALSLAFIEEAAAAASAAREGVGEILREVRDWYAAVQVRRI